MSRIHYHGIPYHCQRRWGATLLSSVRNWDRVTCKNCLKTKPAA